MRAVTRRSAEPSDREMLRAILHGNALAEARMDEIADRLESMEASVRSLPQRLPTQVHTSTAQRETLEIVPRQRRLPAVVRVAERIRSEWLRA